MKIAAFQFIQKVFPSFILVIGCENPKPSQTLLTVLEYGSYDGEPVTKVLLQPLTGKYSTFFYTSHRENISLSARQKSVIITNQ